MVHPIFMAVLRRPDLLAQHAANYVALLREIVADVGKGLAVRAACWGVAAIGLLLGLGLGGVAVMLGVLHGRFEWVLLAVPGVAFAIAIVGAIVALRPVVKPEVDELREQMEADRVALRMMKEAGHD